MAGRNFGRLYRFSSANRPLAPSAANTSGQDSAQYDGRQYRSATRDTSLEPRARSPPPLSPRRDQPLPASPTYSIKKATSPPPSPPYRAPAARVISSPPKTVDEYSKSPEAKQKPAIQKTVDKVTKSDRHHESSKTVSSHKVQQPNAINIKGDNVGAVMEIVESSKREGAGHVIKKKETARELLNKDNFANDQYNEASKTPNSSMPKSTFLNSNFQSVNNSLLFNATLAHRDPGLHLAFSLNPTGDRLTVDDKKQHHTKY
ncbi:uncharacterized protein LOC120071611 isoform X2 [Benincasa hispida]|uniref:uncharacterized protein LOC120071611 isoform X2 n=1 Tax=Benincasa hispida TaxID=102211 RepID=UPI00190077DE|nr:uncharacterized protein LOC120071611 isoform X2 [Benincasa hispida]